MVLGFGKSISEVEFLEISNPLTYALPGDILYVAKSSVGTLFCVVNCPALKIPPFPSKSLRVSLATILNGFT